MLFFTILLLISSVLFFFFFNDTATTEIYTLSLHDALPIFGAGVMVGPTLGPTLGGYITDTFSWPWIFYINIPFGVVALLMTLTYLRDSRFARKIERVDWIGLGLLALGIGTLQTMLERGERLDWFASGEVVTY